MYATTVTNKDGTFSPAIRMGEGSLEVHACLGRTFQEEDEAIKPAQRAVEMLKSSVHRLLRAHNYTAWAPPK